MKRLLMGNEAFAHAALEAGVSVVAGYPGTPSSELIETIAKLRTQGTAEDVFVEWSTNEKAALELAAGASLCGMRALFTCKQVGLNVASDALLSLNYVGIRGGLVLFVADDPGPISSQTEQDTRRFAAFAKIPVLDPATPEQGFYMMKAAFELSERYKTPVIVRPTTRIDHASTFFEIEEKTKGALPPEGFEADPQRWVIFPKRAYEAHGEINQRLEDIAHDFAYDDTFARFNPLYENGRRIEGAITLLGEDNGAVELPSAVPSLPPAKLGIAAGGDTVMYVLEALSIIRRETSLAGVQIPSYRFLQIGTPYPLPKRTVTKFFKGLSDVLVLEELDSVLEDELLKVAGTSFLAPKIHGKLTGEATQRGENSTEDIIARIARFFDIYKDGSLGTGRPEGMFSLSDLMDRFINSRGKMTYDGELPPRSPVLCAGCPHRGSFSAVKKALSALGIARDDAVFCGDIGCYTLGNAAPLDAVDTCLCMGGGITMAQGMAVANMLLDSSKKAIAFVGDSTFFASGITGIVNAVYNDHDITLCVLDNSTTAMTGMQPHPGTGKTLMGPESEPIDIGAVLKAVGVRKIIRTDPLDLDGAKEACMEAIGYEGPSAILFESPCVWTKPFSIPAMVNIHRCTGCKKCITEIGCPAIGFDAGARGARSGRRGQAVIDHDQCNGCLLCVSVCPFTAISREDKVMLPPLTIETPSSDAGSDAAPARPLYADEPYAGVGFGGAEVPLDETLGSEEAAAVWEGMETESEDEALDKTLGAEASEEMPPREAISGWGHQSFGMHQPPQVSLPVSGGLGEEKFEGSSRPEDSGSSKIVPSPSSRPSGPSVETSEDNLLDALNDMVFLEIDDGESDLSEKDSRQGGAR